MLEQKVVVMLLNIFFPVCVKTWWEGGYSSIEF